MSGALLQGMLRNGLASPYLLGISAGSGLVIVFFISFGLIQTLIPLAAWIGAILTTLIVFVLSKDGNKIVVERLVLGGVAVSSLFGALQATLLLQSEDGRIQAALNWLIGSLNARGWQEIKFTALPILLALFIGLFLYRQLNLLSLGDELSVSLGTSLFRSRCLIGAIATLLAACAVSIGGLIGFIGLIVPHFSRLLIGNDFKYILPFSALIGALTLSSADLISRLGPIEIPVGIVTALLGAPVVMENLKLENFSTGYTNDFIIKSIDLSVKSGEWLGVIGPNGAGKSTLIKGICRIIKPFQGSLFLKGKDINRFTNKIISQTISFLPQQFNSNMQVTVKELVALGRSPYKNFWEFDLNKTDKKKINEALNLVDMYDFKDTLITQLSGGQRQRAYLALALAQDPEILILDEPTNALDLKYQIKFLEIIKKLKEIKDVSIITILHDLNLTARYAEKILALKNGRSLGYGTCSEIISDKKIKDIFDVNVLVSETPYGKQVYAIN